MSNQQHNELDLAVLLSMSLSSLIHDLHKQLDELGFDDIRPAHGFVFKRLIPDGATGIEIADYLGITKQGVSKMVDDLEDKGYVTRNENPLDKRAKMIVLTERGWSAIQTKEKILANMESRWSEIVGSERMNMLKEDLTTLVRESNEGSMLTRTRPVW